MAAFSFLDNSWDYQHPEWLDPGIVARAAVGRRLSTGLIYCTGFLAAFFLEEVAFFFVATGAFFRFLDATVGVATPVLTASLPSAVPMASAALLRNGAA